MAQPTENLVRSYLRFNGYLGVENLIVHEPISGAVPQGAEFDVVAVRFPFSSETADFELPRHSQLEAIERPGLVRKQVENVLRSKGAAFTQVCCVEERSALADLVKVGEEDHPWYCSENYVHVAFEFAATESHDSLKSYDSDVLKRVRIFQQLGGYLLGSGARISLVSLSRRSFGAGLSSLKSRIAKLPHLGLSLAPAQDGLLRHLRSIHCNGRTT